MARIIILAQPSELFAFVEHALVQEGYYVRFVYDPTLSATKINALLPNLVIVDAASSGPATRELCARIRNRHTDDRARILILGSAVDADECGVSALENDAYLERPIHPRSLLTRVRELLGSKNDDDPKSQIVVAELVIDPASCRVTRSGRLVPLTQGEFRLLYYLASHPNVVCRRDRLLGVISGNPQVMAREVDVYVRHLRTKIEEDSRRPRFIRSVRAQGYCFQIPAGRPSSNPSAEDGSVPQGFEYAESERRSG